MFIPREIEAELYRQVNLLRPTVVNGPRAVGKTVLFKRLASELKDFCFLSFEDLDKRFLLEEDLGEFASKYVTPYKGVLFDECQYVKGLGRKLAKLMEITPKKKFFIATSSLMNLLNEDTKPHPYNIIYLLPFNFKEYLQAKDPSLLEVFNSHKEQEVLGIRDMNKLLLSYLTWGGYPEVVLQEDLEERRRVLKRILNDCLLHDLKEVTSMVEEAMMLKLLKILAFQTASIIKYNELESLLGLSHHKLKYLLEVIEDLSLVKFVSPYFTNKRLEISKNPKAFFIDSGLRNMLLNDFKPPMERSDRHKVYENFIFRCLYEREPDIRYYRSKSGGQLDFVLKGSIPVKVQLEPKKSIIPRSLRGFIKKYRPTRAIIFTENQLNRTNIEGCTVYVRPFIDACRTRVARS